MNINIQEPMSISLLLEIRSTWKQLGTIFFLNLLKEINPQINFEDKKIKENTKVYLSILNCLSLFGEKKFIEKLSKNKIKKYPPKKSYKKLDSIISDTCDYFNIEYNYLINSTNKSKNRNNAQLVISILAQENDFTQLEISIALNTSQPQINRLLSNYITLSDKILEKRDITTIINNIKTKK